MDFFCIYWGEFCCYGTICSVFVLFCCCVEIVLKKAEKHACGGEGEIVVTMFL